MKRRNIRAGGSCPGVGIHRRSGDGADQAQVGTRLRDQRAVSHGRRCGPRARSRSAPTTATTSRCSRPRRSARKPTSTRASPWARSTSSTPASCSPAARTGRSPSAVRRTCSATSITGRLIATARCSASWPTATRRSGGHKVTSLTTYYGERHATSNKAINKPEDMKGLKIRVPDAPLYTMFPRAVGANPTPIAFAEVYLALQNGTVDAQENPLPTIDAKKFYEVQKFIVLTGHITDALLTIVAGGTWNKLSAADKKTFEAVLKEAADQGCTKEIVEIEKGLAARVREEGQDRRPRRPHAVPQRRDEAAQRPGRDLGQGHVRQAAGAQVAHWQGRREGREGAPFFSSVHVVVPSRRRGTSNVARGEIPRLRLGMTEVGRSIGRSVKTIPRATMRPASNAPVAQLDRVLGYEPRGRGFESCRARHLFKGLQRCEPFFFVAL